MSCNVVILDFLTNEAGIDVESAAALVGSFQRAGYVKAGDIWALTSEEVKKLVTDSVHKRRIQAALRRGPGALKTEQRKKKKPNMGVESDRNDHSLEPPEDLPIDQLLGKYKVNRSPVMILWSAVIAYSNGFRWDEALSLASTVTALNAQAKAESIWGPSSTRKSDQDSHLISIDGPQEEGIMLLGRQVPACRTDAGVRGCLEGRAVHPKSAEDRVRQAFPGAGYAVVYSAMRVLAARLGRASLAADPRRAYALYERFRPAVDGGAAGWGAAGELSVEFILRLAAELPSRPPSPAGGGAHAGAVDIDGRRPEQGALVRGHDSRAEVEDRGDADADATEDVMAAVARAGIAGLSRAEVLVACGSAAAAAVKELLLEGVLLERDGRLRML